MAMAVRTVGAWRVISDSMASAARVVCGVTDPTRNNKPQQSLSYSDNTSSNLPRRAMIADGVLRCQAATLTAVRETTADGVKDLEMRCLEDSRAALREAFSEERRPVARFLSRAMAETPVDMAAESSQRRVYHGRRGGGDYYPGLSTPKEEMSLEETLPEETAPEMIANFEAALQEAGRNAETIASLAVRAWRKLGDADRAEALYMKALELAPEDSTIQASYAQFLWQCDA